MPRAKKTKSAQATLTRCDATRYGWVIGWKAANQTTWRLVLEAVRSLPRSDREYDPDDKVWWVSDEGMEIIACLFINAAEMMEDAGQTDNTLASVESAFRTLWIVPGAPQEAISAVYRALSKKYHPDTGGDHESMVRLNAAYETVTSWVETQQRRGA